MIINDLEILATTYILNSDGSMSRKPHAPIPGFGKTPPAHPTSHATIPGPKIADLPKALCNPPRPSKNYKPLMTGALLCTAGVVGAVALAFFSAVLGPVPLIVGGIAIFSLEVGGIYSLRKGVSAIQEPSQT